MPRRGARGVLPARARGPDHRGRARRGGARLAPLRPHPAGERLHRGREVARGRPRPHAGHARRRAAPSTGRRTARGAPTSPIPDANLRLGARYLRQLLDTFSGRHRRGARRVQRRDRGACARGRRRPGLAPEDEFLESIPFAETRFYVKRVLFFQSVYASLYGLPLDAAPPIAPVASLPAAEPRP